MKRMLWIVGILAVVALLLGVALQALSFLLWVAPVFLLIAILLFILTRSGGRRIPR
jgi:hypothetical protein